MKKFAGLLKAGLKCFGLFVIIILFTWGIKATLFSVYSIKSHSMMPTLQAGNYILVSKFPYNLRTPEYYPLTYISFPFFSTGGLRQVQPGDLIVFDLPILPYEQHPTEKTDYVKRCVGLPGDTMLIGRDRFQMQRDTVNTILRLTGNAVDASMVIPGRGDRLSLADSTRKVWESMIVRDGNDLHIDSLGQAWINGVEKTTYEVRQDYFFLQGDNHRFSNDSRNWGLVPKRDLIGRVELILWPWPPQKVRD